MNELPLGTDVGGHGFIGYETGVQDESGQPIRQWWSIGRLWKIADAMPWEDVPLEALGFVLEEPSNFIASLGGRALRNRDVAEKARRIWEADLEYPVIVAAEGWLMDGCHRIMKAWALASPTIRAVRFTHNPTPDFVCVSALMVRGEDIVVF